MNTLFSHKVSHQITWIANDRQINTTTTMAPSALQKSDRIYHRKTDPQNFDYKWKIVWQIQQQFISTNIRFW